MRHSRIRRGVAVLRVAAVAATAVGTLSIGAAILPSTGDRLPSAGALSPVEQVPQPVADIRVGELRRVGNGCCPAFVGPGGNTYAFQRGTELWLASLNGARSEQLIARSVGIFDWQSDGTLVYTDLPDRPTGAELQPPSNPTIVPIPLPTPATWDAPPVLPTPPALPSVTPGPPRADPRTHANRRIPVTVYAFDPKTNAARQVGVTDQPFQTTAGRDKLVLFQAARISIVDIKSGATRDIPGLDVSSRDLLSTPQVAVAPDGRIAVADGTRLLIVDPSTGVRTVVTDKLDHKQWQSFAWSRDGSQLAYAIAPDRFAPPELWVRNLQGDRRIYAAGPGERGIFAGITWLPDRDVVLFQHYPGGSDATKRASYMAVSPQGGQAKTLFTNGLGLRLSPDGHYLSFTRDIGTPDERGNFIAVLGY